MCLQSVELAVCGVLLIAASLVASAGDGRALSPRKLQVAMSVAAVLVSLVTVMQFFGLHVQGGFGFHSDATNRMRMYATLGNPDFVASFLAVAIPASMGLSLTVQRLRSLCIAASVLIGVAIILTGSRSGVISLAAGVSVIAFTVMHKRALILLAVVVACALAVGTELNPRSPWESLRGRIFIWQVSLSDGAARSAFGSGPGTFAYDYPVRLGQFLTNPERKPLSHFAGHERHALNDYVEAWHDTGWVGLVSLLVLLGSWFAVAIRRLRKSCDEARTAVGASIASVSALCVASLFDFPMHRAETWALLWLCMAVPLASATLSPAPPRRLGPLRHAGVALLVAAGCYFAFVPMAASYELAKGESEEKAGRLESSDVAYRAALRWEPSSPDANFNLVRAIAKAGDYSGALTQSRIATRYVNEPELYLLRSRILQNAGRQSEARHELETATRLFPYSMELRDEVTSFSMPEGQIIKAF